jgi:hypothetical protein
MTTDELLQAMNELELRNPKLQGVDLTVCPDGSGCMRGRLRHEDVPPPFSAALVTLYPENYEIEFAFTSLEECVSLIRTQNIPWRYVNEPKPVDIQQVLDAGRKLLPIFHPKDYDWKCEIESHLNNVFRDASPADRILCIS